VLDVVDDFDGNTYRAVYTVRFAGAVYVLHAFQKKSKRGDEAAAGGAGRHRAAAEASERGLRTMVKKREPIIPVTRGSGNVFADLGLPEPEEELTKAQLAGELRQVIKRRRLTQVEAATLMGIDQPKVSALLNGRLANFSSERLMRLLTALGQDVEIIVKATPRARRRGRIRVLGEVRA
jgi:predicted XRE-type DNA-binding protein